MVALGLRTGFVITPELALRTYGASIKRRVTARLQFDARIGEKSLWGLRCPLGTLNCEVLAGDSLLAVNVTYPAQAVAFAVNRPDSWGRLPLALNTAIGLPVFGPRDGNPTADAWIAAPAHIAAITGLHLGPREALLVYWSELLAVGEPTRQVGPWLSALQQIVGLLPEPTPEPPPTDLAAALPADLRHLAPFFSSLAIADDADRERRVRRLSRSRRQALVDEIGPLLPRIDSFLDSFGAAPLPDAAIAIGQLAELVAELRAPEA